MSAQHMQCYLLRRDDGDRLYLRVELPPDVQDDNTGWVNIIPGEGRWKGHPDGEFELTEDVIDSMIANFDKESTPLQFDYEHSSENPAVLARGGPIPSSGHIYKLEKRHGEAGAQLWAWVEWTDTAARMIRAREYQFNSPVIDMDAIDVETGDKQGPTLISAGLTDRPFLQGQQPIRLRMEMPEDKQIEMQEPEGEKVEMQEGEPEGMTADALVEKIAEAAGVSGAQVVEMLTGMIDDLATWLGAEEDAMAMKQRLSKKPEATTESERKLRLRESNLEAREAKLEERLAALEESDKDRKAKEAEAFAERVKLKASELIDSGIYLESAREDLEAELSADFDRAVRIAMSKRPDVPRPQARPESATPSGKQGKEKLTLSTAGLDPTEQRVARSLMMTKRYDEDAACRRLLSRREN